MSKILKLKITLIDSTPQIWREVLMEKNKTFEDLHYMIQAVMEWKNYHLHDIKFSFFMIAISSLDS
ncbi:MAG: IS1096 element passenger TnpR family protein [bacterium]